MEIEGNLAGILGPMGCEADIAGGGVYQEGEQEGDGYPDVFLRAGEPPAQDINCAVMGMQNGGIVNMGAMQPTHMGGLYGIMDRTTIAKMHTPHDVYRNSRVVNCKDLKDGENGLAPAFTARPKTITQNAEVLSRLMKDRQDREEDFLFRYVVDKHGRLERLLWQTPFQRNQSIAYADCLIMDTVYETNCLHIPLFIIHVCDRFGRTVPIAQAFIIKEDFESYRWVLQILARLFAVTETIITDDEENLVNAVRHVFPRAMHHLCVFQMKLLIKQVSESYLGQSYVDFLSRFLQKLQDKDRRRRLMALMESNLHPEEFESKWNDFLSEVPKEDKLWSFFEKLEAHKQSWAFAYKRSAFTVFAKSTQRAVGFNSKLRRRNERSPEDTSLVEIYERLEDILKATENNKKTKRIGASLSGEAATFPVGLRDWLSAVSPYVSKKIIEIYKRSRYFSIRWEEGSNNLIHVYSLIDERELNTTKIDEYRSQYVSISSDNTPSKCSCSEEVANGVPCCHMLAVLENAQGINWPLTMIKGRWLLQECDKRPTEQRTKSEIENTSFSRNKRQLHDTENYCGNAYSCEPGWDKSKRQCLSHQYDPFVIKDPIRIIIDKDGLGRKRKNLSIFNKESENHRERTSNTLPSVLKPFPNCSAVEDGCFDMY